MKANQAEFPIRTLCETLSVSTSGFYDWHERPPSARAQANATLLQSIRAAHQASDETYGMPRIRAELADQGTTASRKRIASLMRQDRLRGVSRRRGWCVTTERHPRQRAAAWHFSGLPCFKLCFPQRPRHQPMEGLKGFGSQEGLSPARSQNRHGHFVFKRPK